MNILFAAKTGFDYNRTKVLYDGLKKMQNINVQLFKLPSKRNFNQKEFAKITKNIDFIYIPPFRFSDARFFRKQTKLPIIFDPLVSVYLTKVIDYKQYWKAPQKYIADFINFRSCDILIADTEHHKSYFSSFLKINEKRIFVLPIGVNTNEFYPKNIKKKDHKFHVGFYGSFIPLQGISKIIETAKILKDNKDIVFDIIGDGYEYSKIKLLIQKYKLKNVILHGRAKYTDLNELINEFDIALGIFGSSKKANYVIPNKVFHYAATKKCILTKNTVGIKEIFTENENVILTNDEAFTIAKNILFLKENKNIRDEIAEKSYNLISKKYNEIKIAERFIEICKHFNSSVQP